MNNTNNVVVNITHNDYLFLNFHLSCSTFTSPRLPHALEVTSVQYDLWKQAVAVDNDEPLVALHISYDMAVKLRNEIDDELNDGGFHPSLHDAAAAVINAITNAITA